MGAEKLQLTAWWCAFSGKVQGRFVVLVSGSSDLTECAWESSVASAVVGGSELRIAEVVALDLFVVVVKLLGCLRTGYFCGETQGKDGTFPWFTGNRDLPAHHSGEPACDCQSQAGTAVSPGCRTIRLHKVLEQPVDLLRRDPNT